MGQRQYFAICATSIALLSFISLSSSLLGCCSASSNAEGKHLAFSKDLAGSTLCVIGDTGTGSQGQWLVAKALETAHCSQVRIVGDLIYPLGIWARFDPALKKKFFAPYAALLQQPTPFFLALGNHDYLGRPDAWLALSTRVENVVIPSRYYSEAWQDLCVFTLDTTPLLAASKRAMVQMHWLRSRYARERQSCRFSIAFGHHPYISSGGHGDAKGALRNAFEAEVIGIVDLYISGHDHHLADEGQRADTRLLISGAGSHGHAPKRTKDPLGFSTGEIGYIALKPERLPEGTMRVSYDIVTVHASGKTLKKTVVRSGMVVGKGVRSKDEQEFSTP